MSLLPRQDTVLHPPEIAADAALGIAHGLRLPAGSVDPPAGGPGGPAAPARADAAAAMPAPIQLPDITDNMLDKWAFSFIYAVDDIIDRLQTIRSDLPLGHERNISMALQPGCGSVDFVSWTR